MTGFCLRCGRLSAQLMVGTMLRLCPDCGLQPQCAEFQHAYRAGDSAGRWICLMCGSVLASQPIKTEVVQAEPPTTAWSC